MSQSLQVEFTVKYKIYSFPYRHTSDNWYEIINTFLTNLNIITPLYCSAVQNTLKQNYKTHNNSETILYKT
jgi:hypothetical protein